jgi:hypothetical protein
MDGHAIDRRDGSTDLVTPPKAGIHPSTSALPARWIPAFAGMKILFSRLGAPQFPFGDPFSLWSLCLCGESFFDPPEDRSGEGSGLPSA